MVCYVVRSRSLFVCGWCQNISINFKNSDVTTTRKYSIRNTASSLYDIGLKRFEGNKTSENIYQHFAEPTVLLDAKKKFQQDEMKDFIEIHESTINFGSPETCDQMSGAIYLHANISEDKCSQCLRLASELVPKYSINQLLVCLMKMNWWSSEASHSLALNEVVKAVDHTCVDRLNSQHFLLSDQLRIAYQWQSLIFSPKVQPKYPQSMIESFPTDTILQSSLPLLVSWLLLVSSMKPQNLKLIQGETGLAMDIANSFESSGTMRMMSEAELVACYQGLQTLCPESSIGVSRFLTQKFGYRL